MPQKTFATNDVLTAADMNALAAPPTMADVTTEQATTSSGYTNLSTVGPQLAISLTNGQSVRVTISAYGFSNGSANLFFASFSATGSVTTTASDTNALRWKEGSVGGSVQPMLSRSTVVTATSTGTATFTMVFRSDGTNTATFGNRRLVLDPKF